MRKRRSRGPFCFVDALVDVEELRVGAVADRVDLDLEAGLVGARDPLLDLRERDRLGGVDARVAGLVAEGLEHHGRAGPERAVHEALHAADASQSSFFIGVWSFLRLRPVASDGR